MALQIRRGTDTQRQALSGPNTPIAGELLYSTDNKKLYIGDGTTTGGTSIGYFGSVEVSGQNTIRSTGTNEALTIVAGANISLITDSNTGTLTIAAAPQELTNGSLRLFQNNITSLNSNEDINIDPAGSGKVNVTGNLTATTLTGNLTGNVSGNVTGNVTGNAGTVTNGIYTTDTATVTNTMLSGSIANNKLANSSLTVGTTEISLGGSSTIIDGLTSLTSSVVFAEEFNNQRINIKDNIITTFNSNDNIEINLSGTGQVVVRTSIITDGIGLNLNPANSGMLISSSMGNRSIFASYHTTNNSSLSTTFVPDTGLLTGFGTSVVGAPFTFIRGRGTPLSPTSLQSGDEINVFDFVGVDPVSTSTSAKMKVIVDSAVSTGIIPSRFEFLTTNSSGVQAARLSVSSNVVTSTVPVKLAVYADATARDAAVTSPTAGMMIFLTATTKFQGYTGSAWVDLN